MSRIIEQDQRLSEKLIEAESRAFRLRKQRRALRQRLMALGQQKEQNILNLEMNELMKSVPERTFSEVLNPSSPRFFSFLNFALLGSSNRTPAESSGS